MAGPIYRWTVPNTPSANCLVKVVHSGLGTYDLTDHPFTITSAEAPVLQVTPTSRNVPASAGTTTFEVSNTGSGTLNWTAAVTQGASWLAIVSGHSGTDRGTITLSYAANSEATSRTGVVTVTATGASGSPQEVTIVQSASPAYQATVRIQPASKQLYLNRTGSTEVAIDGVTNLGSFQFEIGFNGAMVQIDAPTDVQLGPFLGSTGRTTIPVGPAIDNTAGTVVYGAATFGAQQGPSGEGVLATITWTAVGEGTTTLDLGNVQVSDIAGTLIPVNVVGGEITVKKGFWADVNDDGRIDIIDIQLVCAHWNTRAGDPTYDPRYDVDNECRGDGDVDIIDIQLVASWWNRPLPSGGLGRVGSTEPLPQVTLSLRSLPNISAAFLEVWAYGAKDLGGLLFDLCSDAPLGIEAVEPGDLLLGTNNTVALLGPQSQNGGKRVTLGVFDYGVERGAWGSGAVARIRLARDQEVRLENAQAASIEGRPLQISVLGSEQSQHSQLPGTLTLHANHPNPFNTQTRVRFDLPGKGGELVSVRLCVYNVCGELVRVLLEGAYPPNTYTVAWDGRDAQGRELPSGVYLCALHALERRLLVKMSLMR